MTALFSQFNMSTRLEVTDLSMSRGDKVLFEKLSTIVKSGDVLWIEGDNGIGKTTLLEALAGLSRPNEGDISWSEGEEFREAHRLVAYQPHKSFAKATLSAKEDLSFWAKIYDVVNLVTPVLEKVGLADRHNVPTQGLSAGQKRRLGLAKLILSQKPIWIMDEPNAAMDKNGVTLINGLISEHISHGGSAIIASHNATRKLSANTRKLTLKAS